MKSDSATEVHDANYMLPVIHYLEKSYSQVQIRLLT